jgi:two-component sensor histidine kinase
VPAGTNKERDAASHMLDGRDYASEGAAHFNALVEPAMRACREPLLEETLADPIVRALMAADSVDAEELEEVAGPRRDGRLRQRKARGQVSPRGACIGWVEISAKLPISDEQVLLHELNHRVNNEFAAAIGVVSHVAARSSNTTSKPL